jgi:hypothetical protein
MLRLGPNGQLAGCPVGQDPVCPVLIFNGKSPAEFDGVDSKELENILVHDGQLLDGIIDSNDFLRQPEKFS